MWPLRLVDGLIGRGIIPRCAPVLSRFLFGVFMQSAPLPANEPLRLAALDSLDLLYTPAEERFDRLTRVAAQALSMPMALLTLVARDEQWFKSRVGVSLAQTPRAHSFCAHAILDDGPLVVADTRRDGRFHANPLVRAAPRFRFYAGIPLRLAYGVKVGTLCVLDTQPRRLGGDALAMLVDLARVVEEELQREALCHWCPSERGLLSSPQRPALLDAATGSWNRAGFEALLQEEGLLAQRQDQSFALLLLSLDCPTCSDPVVLLEAVSRVRRVVSGVGCVARLAADALVVLVSPCDAPSLARVHRRVRAAIQGRPLLDLRGEPHRMTVNSGGAMVSRPGFDVTLALVDADRRLQLARRRGRGEPRR